MFCDPSTSDTLFAQIRGSEVEYFHRDRLGATLALSSNTGALLTSYRYDVYGTPYASSGSVFVRVSDLTTDPLTTRLFTAREYDSETSLYHYRARTYSPTLGRFLQRDPVGTEDQINLYTYVANNPTNFTDPTGEFAFLAPLIPSFIGWTVSIGLSIGIEAITSSLSDTDDFNYSFTDAWVDFAGGAAGVGLLTKANKIGKLWVVLGNAITGAVGTVIKCPKSELTTKGFATNFAFYTVAGGLGAYGGKLLSGIRSGAKFVAKNPIFGKIKHLPWDEMLPPSKRGNAPISRIDSKPINIHHESQKRLWPFQEVHYSQHKEISHPNRVSEVDRKEFSKWRSEYWIKQRDNWRFK